MTSPIYQRTIPVPIVRQAYEYSCGAACLASCLYYWGAWDGREPELYPLLNTTDEGTSGVDIIQVAQDFGLHSYTQSNLTIDNLKRLCWEGNTVILSIQAWGDFAGKSLSDIWDDGHYVVLVGFRGDLVYLMDPGVAGTYRVMPTAELLDCWHDYDDEGEYDQHSAIILRGQQPAHRLQLIDDNDN